MNKKALYLFIAASLAILIPSPGRFVYGFTLVLEFNLLLIVGTLMNALVKKIDLYRLNTMIVMFTLIAFTIIYRQLLIITQTEVALSLGFLLYLPPTSLFLVGYVFNNSEEPLLEKLKINMEQSLYFSLIGLLYFLFRDIAGYGTFTFWGTKHVIYEKVILDSQKVGVFSFFATMPGSMILSAIIIFIYLHVAKKIAIVDNVMNVGEK
jgi:hypothetical protein